MAGLQVPWGTPRAERMVREELVQVEVEGAGGA